MNGADLLLPNSDGLDQPIETEEVPEAFVDLDDQAELSHVFSTKLDRKQSDISVL